jgi:hypothetical protein
MGAGDPATVAAVTHTRHLRRNVYEACAEAQEAARVAAEFLRRVRARFHLGPPYETR